jgi:predicted membrane GTPase involved in stress response
MHDENPTYRPPLTGYCGRYVQRRAIVERLPDRTRLSPAWSRTLQTHSRDFEWGYAGSGPSQLALAILLDYTREERLALDHYRAFTRAVIAGLDQEWHLTTDQIDQELTALGARVPTEPQPSPERLDG